MSPKYRQLHLEAGSMALHELRTPSTETLQVIELIEYSFSSQKCELLVALLEVALEAF